MLSSDIVLIGYSGHAYVVIEIFQSMGKNVSGYCTDQKVKTNPYGLNYMGFEGNNEDLIKLKELSWFISIGNNSVRKKIFDKISQTFLSEAEVAIHKSAIISNTAVIGQASMCAAGTIINSQAEMGVGVICNSGSIIEHECKVGDFAHIAPGATLAGNVKVGAMSFIGANAVIKEGVTIGKNVMVGAGSVVIRDIPDNVTLVGNPGRILNQKT